MIINAKVKFGNSPVNGIVKDIRNEGPTPDYEEALVLFDDKDLCWVGSCYLSLVQDVAIPQEVTA